MVMDFTAVDFETANGNRGSVCAVGAVRVRDGVLGESLRLLVRPHQEVAEFAQGNTSVHGLTSESVADSLEWPAVYEQLMHFVGSDILVGHNAAFDVSVLLNACSLYEIDWPALETVCTLQLARASLRLATYSLPWVVDYLDLPSFDHHDPLADATASAMVAIELSKRLEIDDLRVLALKLNIPIERTADDDDELVLATLDAQPDSLSGEGFAGEHVCFTGALRSMVRSEAQKLVVEHGGEIDKTVTKKTTMLVTGDFDRLTFQPTTILTAKLRRAFDLVDAGQRLEVVTEDDFVARLSLNEEQLRRRLVTNQTGRSRTPEWVIAQAGDGPGRGDFWTWYRAALAHPDGRASEGASCIWCGSSIPPSAHWIHRDRHVCGIYCNERLKRSARNAWRRIGIVFDAE